MLGFRAPLLFWRLARALTKNVIFLISKSNIFVFSYYSKYFQSTITFDYRWPMRSNFQKWQGLDVLFKFTRQHFVLKYDLNFARIWFWFWHKHKAHAVCSYFLFWKKKSRSKFQSRRIVLSCSSAKNQAWFPRATLICTMKSTNYYPKVGTQITDLAWIEFTL